MTFVRSFHTQNRLEHSCCESFWQERYEVIVKKQRRRRRVKGHKTPPGGRGSMILYHNSVKYYCKILEVHKMIIGKPKLG